MLLTIRASRILSKLELMVFRKARSFASSTASGVVRFMMITARLPVQENPLIC